MQNRTSDRGRGGRQALTTSAQLPLSSRGRGSVGRSEASSAAVRLSPRRPSSRRRTGCRATVRRVPGPPAVSRRRSPSRGTRTRDRRERAELWGDNAVRGEGGPRLGSRTPRSWGSTAIKDLGSDAALDDSQTESSQRSTWGPSVVHLSGLVF